MGKAARAAFPIRFAKTAYPFPHPLPRRARKSPQSACALAAAGKSLRRFLGGPQMERKEIAIIGGGPAGLMAAEVLSRSGHGDRLRGYATAARKFLLAGKSGLNITHSEAYRDFAARFGDASASLRRPLMPLPRRTYAPGQPDLTRRPSSALPAACFRSYEGLAGCCAAGSAGWRPRRPASHPPSLVGFTEKGYIFDTPEGRRSFVATRLSWRLAAQAGHGSARRRLGAVAAGRGVPISDFRPANCGFDVGLDAGFPRAFWPAQPLKGVTATSDGGTIPGEFV